MNRNLFELLRNHQAGAGRKSIVCLEGSSRSGKTWAVLEYLINCSLEMPGLIVSCFRQDATTHRASTVRDFLQIMANRFPKSYTEGNWNKLEQRFTFGNQSVIEFVGAQSPMKLHGPQRDIAWLNEAMEISYEAYAQISRRTSLMTILDWNPSLSHHWVFDKVLTRDDVLHIHSTYRDNPYLSVQQVVEIEKFDPGNPDNVRRGTADTWQWQVYGLGRRGRREGVIFEHWSIEDAWPERMNCQRWGHGVDWGFSQDPTALVECCLFQGDIWVRELVYATGLVVRESESMPGVDSLAGRMREAQVDKNARIHADGARPDLCKELRLAGWANVAASEKGPGSVLAGINLLRGYRLHVQRNSQNVQRELESYTWQKNRATGAVLDIPEDANNHAIDAMRYWALKELRNQGVEAGGVYRGYEARTCLQKF